MRCKRGGNPLLSALAQVRRGAARLARRCALRMDLWASSLGWRGLMLVVFLLSVDSAMYLFARALIAFSGMGTPSQIMLFSNVVCAAITTHG